MSLHRHTNEEGKETQMRDSEVYCQFGAGSTSVKDFGQPFGSCDTKQNSGAGFPDSMLPLAAAYRSSVLDARGRGTNDLCVAQHAVADSSSRSGSRTILTAIVQRNTKVGPIVNSSALVSHTETNEKEPMSQATGGPEAKDITSRPEVLDIQGDEYPATQTTRGGGSGSRFMKPQAGERSRFRPWGYI